MGAAMGGMMGGAGAAGGAGGAAGGMGGMMQMLPQIMGMMGGGQEQSAPPPQAQTGSLANPAAVQALLQMIAQNQQRSRGSPGFAGGNFGGGL